MFCMHAGTVINSAVKNVSWCAILSALEVLIEAALVFVVQPKHFLL